MTSVKSWESADWIPTVNQNIVAMVRDQELGNRCEYGNSILLKTGVQLMTGKEGDVELGDQMMVD